MDNQEKEKLWISYSKSKKEETREKIIIVYIPLVKLVAGRLSMYLGYTVEYEDLVSYGIFGLIDAIDKFDYGKGIKFETYASLRIRGSILDQIRKMDWIPRSVRQKQKKIDAAILEIEKETNKTANDQEIALKLGIDIEEYYVWEGQTKLSNVSSLDEFIEQGSDLKSNMHTNNMEDTEPERVVEQNELKKTLANALEQLTEKEKKVVLLYYYEELTLKEVSKVLDVSESRTSQLHTKALQKMNKILGSNMNILMG